MSCVGVQYWNDCVSERSHGQMARQSTPDTSAARSFHASVCARGSVNWISTQVLFFSVTTVRYAQSQVLGSFCYHISRLAVLGVISFCERLLLGTRSSRGASSSWSWSNAGCQSTALLPWKWWPGGLVVLGGSRRADAPTRRGAAAVATINNSHVASDKKIYLVTFDQKALLPHREVRTDLQYFSVTVFIGNHGQAFDEY